ncbi:MAG: NAD-binding protein, partial [Dehalococcoidales bacterium]|nr:NAD-binding protein [Dehalococcoidales bacterium]
MYVVIAGAGVVGFHIASLLVKENHEVAVVEQSEEALENVSRQLDVKTILGDTAVPRILKEADTHRADLVIAVTDSDETNMITCFMAKELGARMTVARVRNPEYSGYFVTTASSPSAPRKVIRPKTFGVDFFINPVAEAAREIVTILSSFYPTPVESFADGLVQIREFRAEKETLTDKPVGTITFPKPCLVVAMLRAEGIFIPPAEEVIQPGDRVYLIASREHMDEIGRMFAEPQRPARSVVVLGGGRVGVLVAEGLQQEGISVKIIEKSLSRCQEIASKLEGVSLVQGDG